MKKHSQPELQEDTMLQDLRARVAELEAENASLRQLELSVRRTGRLVQALLEKSQDGFLLVTPDLTYLRAIHSVLGNSDADLAGRSVLTKIHPEDRARIREAFSRLLSNPSEAVICQCRVSDREGRWNWMEVEMTDMLDDPDVQAIVFNNRRIGEPNKCLEPESMSAL